MAIHQNHDYNYMAGGLGGVRFKEEYCANEVLAGNKKFTIAHAGFTLKWTKLVETATFRQNLECRLHPLFNLRFW